jgi:hypothetical protein
MIPVEPGMGLADVALTELIQKQLSFERTDNFVPEPIISRRDGEHQTDGTRDAASAWPDRRRT